MCSYDSGPMSHLSNHDGLSISSSDYDSAICSPKSLTLDRDYLENLTLQQLSVIGGEEEAASGDETLANSGDESTLTPVEEGSQLHSQASTDTVLYQSESEAEEEQDTRDRSSTLRAS